MQAHPGTTAPYLEVLVEAAIFLRRNSKDVRKDASGVRGTLNRS